ncbi:helix-turn-helix domain-containing protein [Paenibacillus agricola]|uniref:Helix-turn-helix transcriptional regulator n=1 Tax=Paenibacillus agricola TaxID=2716264 RepID=A0ABX0J535_9BACL|nr:helix-turn-helix domain-containing protein [Paenibacillus agricola]NHN31507.1 helix-turn-helix transcriptional regulator [Paenibacillus agricola]
MIKHFQMTSTSITIFHIFDINTVLLAQDGSVEIAHIHDTIPNFLLQMQQEDFLRISWQTKEDPTQCCTYTNVFGLTYLSKLVEFEEEPYVWVIGPFLMQIPDMDKIDALFRTEQNKQMAMGEFIRSLKLLSNSRIQSAVNILDHAGSIRQTPYRKLNSQQHIWDRLDANDIQYILAQPDENDTKVIELRYELEKELMSAVENGDKKKLKHLLVESKNLFDFSERFPNQPVRAMKNMLIVLNTLLRMAAARGKVQPFFLHHTSEKFSKQIERCDSINSLNTLLDVMYDEYCGLVNHRAISGYSQLVQKAAQHIHVYFSKPLNLKKLAGQCLVHPAHLSRQFKKETGMTLTDFQNRTRINQAKLLLKKDNASIDWIAGQVGFEDAGYFTRIFNKQEGMNPSKYRKEI